MKASGDRYLSRRELALARPSSRSGRTASSAPVDPSRALGPCVPRGNSRGERPQLAPARSLLRYGNGRAGRNLHARRRVDSATHLHDALPPTQAESSTMRWRKKLYDALTVRTRFDGRRPEACGESARRASAAFSPACSLSHPAYTSHFDRAAVKLLADFRGKKPPKWSNFLPVLSWVWADLGRVT